MRFNKLCAVLLTPFMVLLNCPVMAAQATDNFASNPSTEMLHKPIESAEAGKRISIYTEINDPSGVDVVRVYFKSQDAADYTFIALQPTKNQEKSLFESFKTLGSDFKGQAYSGVLPAPAKGSKSFEYLILCKSTVNVVVKSQTYTVPVAAAQGDTAPEKEPIKVYSELSETPSQVSGFSDNIALDTAESGAKFGVIAGLYSGVTTAGGGAISGGTVAASAGGFTTSAAVVGGVAAVLVVGSVAGAAGGGGGGSSSSASSGRGTSSGSGSGSGSSGGGTSQTKFSLNEQIPQDCTNLNNVLAGKSIIFSLGLGGLPPWTTVAEAESQLAGQSASISLDSTQLSVSYSEIDGPDQSGGYGKTANASWVTTLGTHTAAGKWTRGPQQNCTFTISK